MKFQQKNLINVFDSFINNYIIFGYINEYFFKYWRDEQEVIEKNDFIMPLQDGTSFKLVGSDVYHTLDMYNYHEHCHRDFHTSIKNFMLGEAFERLKGYCLDSTKLNKKKFYNDVSHPFKNTLNFATLVRNNANHYSGDNEINWTGYRFEEITWRNRTIKRGMTGNEVEINILETLYLLNELRQFVRDELE